MATAIGSRLRFGDFAGRSQLALAFLSEAGRFADHASVRHGSDNEIGSMFKFLRSKAKQETKMREMLTAARIPLDGLNQVWGPIVATQYDHSGVNAIQRYVTYLVLRRESSGEKWQMLRQVNEIRNGIEGASRPFLTDVNEPSALHWLAENRLERGDSAKA